MQQIIKDFYNALWGTSATTFKSLWYGPKGTPPNRQLWDINADNLLQRANELNQTKNINIFHSCATFKEQKRRQDSVENVKALWLDIDLKHSNYTTIKELAANSLPLYKTFRLGTNFWLVNSGNGLHVYWIFAEPVSKEVWATLAEELHAFNTTHKIPVDSSRTRDCASLLRMPGSWNVKDNPKQVILIKSSTLHPIDNFPKAKASSTIFLKKDVEENQQLALDDAPLDALQMIGKCQVITNFSETGLPNNEPLWYKALSIVRLCDNGHELSHEWSTKDPSYTKAATDAKLRQLANKEIGPSLCASLEELGACAGCLHKDKLKSPIQFAVSYKPIENKLEGIETDDLKKRAQELIALAPNNKIWKVIKEGIYKIVDDIPIRVCAIPFYIINKFCEDPTDLTVTIVLIRAMSSIGIVDFKLPLRLIADTTRLFGEFYARGIFPLDQKLFREYIITYCQKIAHIKPFIAVNALGWQSDDSFVYNYNGDGIARNGAATKSLISTQSVSYLQGLTAKGSIKEWSKIMHIYASDIDYFPHKLSVLCALGTPLLRYTGANGFILSLQGISGSGKTLAHCSAISVWGHPQKASIIGTQDTPTAMLGRLGAIANLPLRIDEITTLPEKRLSSLIYEIVNGRGRSRSLRDGSLSGTASDWRTIALVSTNRSLLELPYSVIAEAERNRILELSVEIPSNIMRVGRQIDKIMQHNFGGVGIEFIKWVTTHPEKTQQITEEFVDFFEDFVDDTKRFWVSCIATACAAAKIGNQLQLFSIDEKTFLKECKSTLQTHIEEHERLIIENRGFNNLLEFSHALHEHLGGHLVLLNEEGKTIKEPLIELKGFRMKLDDGNKKLYVRGPVLKKFIQMHYTNTAFALVKKELHIEESIIHRLGGYYGRYYAFDLKTGENKNENVPTT